MPDVIPPSAKSDRNAGIPVRQSEVQILTGLIASTAADMMTQAEACLREGASCMGALEEVRAEMDRVFQGPRQLVLEARLARICRMSRSRARESESAHCRLASSHCSLSLSISLSLSPASELSLLSALPALPPALPPLISLAHTYTYPEAMSQQRYRLTGSPLYNATHEHHMVARCAEWPASRPAAALREPAHIHYMRVGPPAPLRCGRGSLPLMDARLPSWPASSGQLMLRVSLLLDLEIISGRQGPLRSGRDCRMLMIPCLTLARTPRFRALEQVVKMQTQAEDDDDDEDGQQAAARARALRERAKAQAQTQAPASGEEEGEAEAEADADEVRVRKERKGEEG